MASKGSKGLPKKAASPPQPQAKATPAAGANKAAPAPTPTQAAKGAAKGKKDK